MAFVHPRIVFLLLICNIAIGSTPQRFSVVNGSIKFFADTNLTLKVEGQSNKMNADVVLDGTDALLDFVSIDAKADPKSFETGISLRDRHMREKVFSLDDGSMPEIRFAAGKSSCPKPASRQETTCSVTGRVTLRGVTKPMTVDLKIRGEGNAYKVSAQSALALRAFGIEPPCQLGVCVKDNVKLNFEFQAKESTGRSGGGK
jgi:polyisoprenoid-binding protein YceI